MSPRRALVAVRIVLAALVSGLAVTAGAGAAHAALLTPMQRCANGTAPDASETVFHPGTQVQVTYPNLGANPDNGVLPGDVVQVTVTGSLRYDATNWSGPDGVGTPDAGGIRPYSSTATWNNNPGGWIGSEMPTTALAYCTNAPSLPARLIYRLRDPDLADNAGGFTITTRVWRAPGRISIDGTEVTQGIQNDQGQVALIAGKRTFVRVYVRDTDDGNGPMSGVTASLTVDGVSGTTYPLFNPITTSTTGSDHRSLGDSFLFELPAAALGEGSGQAVVTVTPPAGRGGGWAAVRHVPLSFGPTTSLTVIGIRYSYYDVPAALTTQLQATQPGLNVASGWWQARPLSAWEPLRAMAEDALPVAHLYINDEAPAGTQYSDWGTNWFDCKAAQDATGRWSCAGYVDAKNWEQTYVDQKCPSGGCVAMLLQPEIDAGENGTHWISPAGNSINNMQGEADPNRQGDTLAHELGHSLGLGHTDQSLTGYDTSYPRPDGGMGPFVAIRYTPSIALVSGQNASGAITAYDMMTYNRPAWFSPYSYCKAMANLSGSHPVCQSPLNG